MPRDLHDVRPSRDPGPLIGLVGGLDAGFGLAEATLHLIAGFFAVDAWGGGATDRPDDGHSAVWKGVPVACVTAGIVLYAMFRLR